MPRPNQAAGGLECDRPSCNAPNVDASPCIKSAVVTLLLQYNYYLLAAQSNEHIEVHPANSLPERSRHLKLASAGSRSNSETCGHSTSEICSRRCCG